MKNFIKRLALFFGVCFIISMLGVVMFLISKIPYIEIIIAIVLVPFVLMPVFLACWNNTVFVNLVVYWKVDCSKMLLLTFIV